VPSPKGRGVVKKIWGMTKTYRYKGNGVEIRIITPTWGKKGLRTRGRGSGREEEGGK
jgi:hypothetical protein